MANYALIDGYLESLRSSIRWCSDLEDVIAEVEDHLISATERFEARGTERMAAQQRTLDEFGDPKVLAVAFASTPTGGIAVPTTFTRTAGLLAILSAIAWIIGLIAVAISAGLPDRNGDPTQFIASSQTVAFMIGAFSLLAGGLLMVVAMIGLYRRHGSLGILGIGGLAITSLGVATLLIAWAFALWMTLIGLGVLLFAISLARRDVAPRLWTIVWGGGMAAGAITWYVLRWLEVGSPDQWGDYPLAVAFALPIGVVTMAIGLAGMGRWLRSEEPADLTPNEPLISA
ncbi:MAG: hypothetical protein ACR2N7_04235 [Acidimicrobiia bacterium]